MAVAEFYLWPRGVSYALTFTIALCVLSQTLAVMASFYRHPRNRATLLEAVLELLVLGNVFAVSLLQGQAIQGYEMSLYTAGGYSGLRVLFFAAVALCALCVAAAARRPRALLALVASAATLPAAEMLTGRWFACLYIAAYLFWLARSVVIGLSRYREIRTNLSALSVKNAVDSLHTGVMFCERGGFTVLCNVRMQWLMSVLTGGARRNGALFLRMLASGEVMPGCSITWFEGENACHLPDGSVWLISITDLTIKRKKYFQLAATEITERWRLTAQLQARNGELTRRQSELTQTLMNLQTISRERETQRARMRAHDILGGRLTLLLRAVRGEPKPDYGLLRTLTAGLVEELKAAESAHSPRDDMEIFRQTFEAIGVKILLDGELPDDAQVGKLLVDIAKEAVTNAVRHGLATEVSIELSAGEGRRRMRITDNGKPPAAAITEGGGLSGMRNRLHAFGGALRVTTRPGFALDVDLPETTTMPHT